VHVLVLLVAVEEELEREGASVGAGELEVRRVGVRVLRLLPRHGLVDADLLRVVLRRDGIALLRHDGDLVGGGVLDGHW
jgi:hypothetical protein